MPMGLYHANLPTSSIYQQKQQKKKEQRLAKCLTPGYEIVKKDPKKSLLPSRPFDRQVKVSYVIGSKLRAYSNIIMSAHIEEV